MRADELQEFGCENLAAAIIRRAMLDYENALSMQEKNPDSQAARSDIEVLRRFFLSPYFMTLSCGVQGEYIISKVEDDFKQKTAKKKREWFKQSAKRKSL